MSNTLILELSYNNNYDDLFVFIYNSFIFRTTIEFKEDFMNKICFVFKIKNKTILISTYNKQNNILLFIITIWLIKKNLICIYK